VTLSANTEYKYLGRVPELSIGFVIDTPVSSVIFPASSSTFVTLNEYCLYHPVVLSLSTFVAFHDIVNVPVHDTVCVELYEAGFVIFSNFHSIVLIGEPPFTQTVTANGYVPASNLEPSA
jgi:hypothetical protein